MRLWLSAPDWLFRVIGATVFLGFIAYSSQKYFQNNFWELGPYLNLHDGLQIASFEVFEKGRVLHMPWIPLLVDFTFVLIALSFIVRIPPRTRVDNGWVILFTMFTGFAPLIPILLAPVLGLFHEHWQSAYEGFLGRKEITRTDIVIGATLMTLGNLLDIWGYLVLCRSFSIVPEPRELKVTGPYRFVRHPVYLGQFLSQGGVWLFFAQQHAVWVSFYVLFVAMQLYRSKLEDRTLAEAFGDEYRQWQKKTFWFV